MAVKLRLMRMGKKKQPTYRVVAADPVAPRRPVHRDRGHLRPAARAVGHHASTTTRPSTGCAKGAQPTERVRKLLEISGAWDEFRGKRPGRDGRRARRGRRPRPTGRGRGDDRRRRRRRRARRRRRRRRRDDADDRPPPSAVLEHLVALAGRRPRRRARSTSARAARCRASTVRVGPVRHGPGHRQAGPGGPGHPHGRAGRRRPRRHRRRGRVRRLSVPVRARRRRRPPARGRAGRQAPRPPRRGRRRPDHRPRRARWRPGTVLATDGGDRWSSPRRARTRTAGSSPSRASTAARRPRRCAAPALRAEPLDDPDALWVHDLVGSDGRDRRRTSRSGTCVVGGGQPGVRPARARRRRAGAGRVRGRPRAAGGSSSTRPTASSTSEPSGGRPCASTSSRSSPTWSSTSPTRACSARPRRRALLDVRVHDLRSAPPTPTGRSTTRPSAAARAWC